MTPRIERLRQQSLETRPSISPERAELITRFYQSGVPDRVSVPVGRALSFKHLCEQKTIYLGEGELIVGERGPAPKATPTFPELCCHSLEDLRILNSRPRTTYAVSDESLRVYERLVIPFWRGRSMRDRIFDAMSPEWKGAYDAGIFTEFMEQRAPGHTVLDGKIYACGMLGFKTRIAEAIAALDFLADPDAYAKREQLKAMDIACDAVILFARRHADRARELAAAEADLAKRADFEQIAAVCGHVPAHAPRTFREALQAYWWCHLAVITELNGWDSFCPGHLDQHLLPFYRQGLADGTLTPESARELLQAFFIKFNNHPAPPKVGVTAAESGTYTDFANINLAGLLPDGADGSNEVTHLLLDIVDEMHLLQPSSNLQLSRRTPDAVLAHALRVVRKGYGFPSLFNADAVVAEQLRQGKTLEDARAGGCSGCVETGAFGKEAYILTGYFNLPKILELALHDGFDPRTRTQLGPHTGAPAQMARFDDVFAAFRTQLRCFIDLKIRGNQVIERLYATLMPAPFLSVLTDDCIAKGLDYNAGGARYNNTYIQFVGIGTLTDSLSALRHVVFSDESGPPLRDGLVDSSPPLRDGPVSAPAGRTTSSALSDLLAALHANFNGREEVRQRLLNRTPKYGNDDDAADALAVRAFNAIVDAVDGRPNTKGGHYRVEMLPTTSHVYFGSLTGATPDGRKAGLPLSEGISPVQGADRRGPTAVIKSAAKMDPIKTGGALLNMKFTPSLLAGEEGIDSLARLVRTFFAMNGHHLQFNVVRAEALRQAQDQPESHRDLIVRVAGYSDYFCDLSRDLQDEIIARTEHQGFGG